MPRRGDDFAGQAYVPALGDVVHLNWSPAAGREMLGPHYGLVLSAHRFNQATGYVVLAPITSKVGKLSGFELPIKAGRVNGAVILSGLRSVDYEARSVQYEAKADQATFEEANRRVRMIFP